MRAESLSIEHLCVKRIYIKPTQTIHLKAKGNASFQATRRGPFHWPALSIAWEVIMKTSDKIEIKELETNATLVALNAALAAAGIEAEQVISIQFVPGVHVTVGRRTSDRYHVLYRA